MATLVEYKRLLKDILELSLHQRHLLEDNRIVELLENQRSRDELFTELKAMGRIDFDDEASGLIDKIVESDRSVTLNLESALDSLKVKLKKMKEGSQASRAYSVQG